VNHLGQRVVAALGPAAAGELLEMLERSDADRAALIGRLPLRDGRTVARLAADRPRDDAGEIARLQLLEALRREVGHPG
jgi:hypothetical protein